MAGQPDCVLKGSSHWWSGQVAADTVPGGGDGSDSRVTLLAFRFGNGSGGKTPPETGGRGMGGCRGGGLVKMVAPARRHLKGGWPEQDFEQDGSGNPGLAGEPGSPGPEHGLLVLSGQSTRTAHLWTVEEPEHLVETNTDSCPGLKLNLGTDMRVTNDLKFRPGTMLEARQQCYRVVMSRGDKDLMQEIEYHWFVSPEHGEQAQTNTWGTSPRAVRGEQVPEQYVG
eukprot:g37317.t1